MGNRQGGGAKDDTKTYRDGYPEETMDDLEMDLNVAFYTNKIASKGWDGDKIDDIHKTWWGDYDKLESKHNYIQWLFPIHEESRFNSQSQALQRHEVRAIRRDPKATARFLKSYDMILDFWGFEVVDRLTGRLERRKPAHVAMERLENLENHGHNYMRITRVLKCLGEMGFEHYKLPFLKALGAEVYHHRTVTSAESGYDRYWKKTLVRYSDQFELEKYLAPFIAASKANRRSGSESRCEFSFGERVEVKYKDKWYEGTFEHYRGYKKKCYAVQCDSDKKGVMTWAPVGNVRSLEMKEEKTENPEKKKKNNVKRPKITWPREAEIMRRAVTVQLLSKMSSFGGAASTQDPDLHTRLSKLRQRIFQEFVGEEQYLSHTSYTRFEMIRAGSAISSKDDDDDEIETAKWFFEDDTKWAEYSKRDAEKLSQALERGDSKVKLSNRYGDYEVNLPSNDKDFGSQINTMTKKSRRVRVKLPKEKMNASSSNQDDSVVVVSASQACPTGLNFEVTMHVADWKKHAWIGLYKVGQLDEVIEHRAISIGKNTSKKKKKKKSYDYDEYGTRNYGDDDDEDETQNDKNKTENDHSDDAVIRVVFDKVFGAWDTSLQYEFRYFDAGWDVKRNKLRFVPSRGPVLTSESFRFSGQVDSNVKSEPKPKPKPAEDRLASNRKEKRRKYSWEGGHSTSSAWSGGGGLPGREGVGKEVKNGLYRNRTRVKVKFGGKWYEGVFMKSNFSRRPTQPYAVQCDCDKKGVLTWASIDSIEIIKGDDDDDDNGVSNGNGDKETSGGTAWHVDV